MATKKYKIKNSNLLHNGKVYKIGSVIELDEIQARKLENILTCVGGETKTATQKSTNNKTKTEKVQKPATDETKNAEVTDDK